MLRRTRVMTLLVAAAVPATAVLLTAMDPKLPPFKGDQTMDTSEHTDPPPRRRTRVTNLLVAAAVPATAVLLTAMEVKIPKVQGD
jgi:hypothetical protein